MPVANVVGQADNLLIDGQHPFWNGFQARGNPVGRIFSSVQRASNILPLGIAGLSMRPCSGVAMAAALLGAILDRSVRTWHLSAEPITAGNVRQSGVSGRSHRTLQSFAVGTRVTSRPPHRSVRAAFPHTACMGLSLSRVSHTFSCCYFILLFDPRREHSSVPTAYHHRRRAQRR